MDSEKSKPQDFHRSQQLLYPFIKCYEVMAEKTKGFTKRCKDRYFKGMEMDFF